MANILAHKVVATLPDPLEPNAIYAVRAGEGFDLYIADSTGAVAHRVNGTREWDGTQAEFDALGSLDPATTYFVAG